MPPFICHYDTVKLFFLLLVVLLLLRHMVFHTGMTRRFTSVIRSETENRFLDISRTISGGVALLCFGSVLGVVALGIMLLLPVEIDGRHKGGLDQKWAVLIIVLVAYGLYPVFWISVGLVFFLILFCLSVSGEGEGGERKTGAKELNFLCLLVISNSVVSLSQQVQRGAWLLCLCSALFVISFIFSCCRKKEETCWQDCISLWRPILLLVLAGLAQKNGLDGSARAAFEGFLLDILVQFTCLLWPACVFIRLAVPPMPGFVVLWLGLHALMGFSSESNGWGLVSLLMLGGFAMMAMSETLALLQALIRQGKAKNEGIGLFLSALVSFRNPALILSIFLPSLAGLAGIILYGSLYQNDFAVLWRGGSWQSAFWRNGIMLNGGDGAVLALPLLWPVMIILFLLFCRPWTVRAVRPDSHIRHVEYRSYFSSLEENFWPYTLNIKRFFPKNTKKTGRVMRYYGAMLNRHFEGLDDKIFDETISGDKALGGWLVFIILGLIFLGVMFL